MLITKYFLWESKPLDKFTLLCTIKWQFILVLFLTGLVIYCHYWSTRENTQCSLCFSLQNKTCTKPSEFAFLAMKKLVTYGKPAPSSCPSYIIPLSMFHKYKVMCMSYHQNVVSSKLGPCQMDRSVTSCINTFKDIDTYPLIFIIFFSFFLPDGVGYSTGRL